MLSDRWTLETHGCRLQGLSAPRGLLLGLEETLVSTLADWNFMGPLLLLLKLRPIRPQLWTTLRSHARIHLSCVGGHVVGLLVLGVWGRQRGLGSSLWVGHSIGWRLEGCVPCNLWGSR